MDTLDNATRNYTPKVCDLAPETAALAARLRALPSVRDSVTAVRREVNAVSAIAHRLQEDLLDPQDVAGIDWASGFGSAHTGHNREDWILDAALKRGYEEVGIACNLQRICNVARRFAREHGRTAEANRLAGWPADI